MIKLDDKWCVDADGYQYVLFRKGKEYEGKGFARLDATYHMTLDQAVERYARLREASIITSEDIDLDEAVAAIRELNQEIRQLKEAVRNAVTRG